MNTSFRRPLQLALLASTVSIALLSGCANGLSVTPGSNPTAQPASPSPTATPTPTETSSLRHPTPHTPTAEPTTVAPSTQPSSSPAGTASCALGDLSVGVKASAGGAAAGSNYVLLTFKNRTSSTCTMYGYPGVSFVGGGNGTQLGTPAVRNATRAPRTVRLRPGATTTALLQIANAGNYDPEQCVPTSADGFRVYPPGSRSAAYVKFAAQACQRDPGESKQLSVSPVGTAG